AMQLEPAADASSDHRHRRRRALEQTALYRDRWGAAGPVGQTADSPSPITAALGARPDAGDTAHDWDEAARAVAEAFDIPCPRPVAAEVEPSSAL
ncbi:MAG: hypothetical protein M3396_04305, partial [Actinomycetota bacterium]|nr:hypothetical protein [Actinomycetota bacterium]